MAELPVCIVYRTRDTRTGKMPVFPFSLSSRASLRSSLEMLVKVFNFPFIVVWPSSFRVPFGTTYGSHHVGVDTAVEDTAQ